MEIERATATLLKNMRYNRDILKSRETRVSLNSLRKQWLDRQKKYNYQSEYDRIRGLLQDPVLKGTSTVHIKNRIKTSENMDVGMKPNKEFDNLYLIV